MTTIKDYVDNIEKEVKDHQENQKEDDINFTKSNNYYICPYCGFDVVMTLPRRMKDEYSELEVFRSECVECGKSWILEIDQNNMIKVYKVDSTIGPNPED